MVAGIFISSIFIDVVTYIIFKITQGFTILLISLGLIRKRKPIDPQQFKVSVVIPAYNEERYIERAIDSAFNQTVQPERVIVIDDCSTDNTPQICNNLKQKCPNLHIIRQPQNKGKAFNISYVLNSQQLSEITLVLDADTYLSKDYLQEILKPFANKRVAISSGMSLPFKPKNLMGKIICRGAAFQYLFFCFRKEAQAFRNSIPVISGDSSAYRTSFLKGLGGFPQGTVTEDMDITWIALEKGHRVCFQKKAHARSNDPSTLIGHWKQITRWYSGSIQCIFRHGRNLLKAKPLLITTIIPVYFDTMIYAPMFLIFLILIPFYPLLSLIFFTADLTFTIIAILYLNWRWIIRLPEIYFIKFIWSLAWLTALLKTTMEFIFGKTYWGGAWTRDDFYVEGQQNQNANQTL